MISNFMSLGYFTDYKVRIGSDVTSYNKKCDMNMIFF